MSPKMSSKNRFAIIYGNSFAHSLVKVCASDRCNIMKGLLIPGFPRISTIFSRVSRVSKSFCQFFKGFKSFPEFPCGGVCFWQLQYYERFANPRFSNANCFSKSFPLELNICNSQDKVGNKIKWMNWVISSFSLHVLILSPSSHDPNSGSPQGFRLDSIAV